MKRLVALFFKFIALIAGLTLVYYYYTRSYYLLMTATNLTDKWFMILLFLAETHTIIHSFGFVINALRLRHHMPFYRFRRLDHEKLPAVSILITARHEPIEIVEKSLIVHSAQDYQTKQIYLLDGSTDPHYKAEYQKLAKYYGVNYFSPTELSHSKAQTINLFLPQVQTKYLAVFDIDQNPMPDFLKTLVSVAETDSKIGLVQSPQIYSNINVSPIALGAALQNSIFYESICEAKGNTNAMFCCGTNFVMRTEALKQVGGFDETSITEDFATSIRLHMKNWQTIYYNHVRVFGTAPENFRAYLAQQARWAGGTAQVFNKLIRYFFRDPISMSASQWWEYVLSSSYYFVGWAFFILMMGPIMFLLFGLPTYYIAPEVYIGSFVPYMVMMSALFYSTMRSRNYKPKSIFTGMIMGYLTFPILMMATFKGFFGRKLSFVVTVKNVIDQLKWWELWPWLVMIGLNLAAIINGIFNWMTNPYAMAVNIFWCLYHLAILSNIFELNRKPKLLPNLR